MLVKDCINAVRLKSVSKKINIAINFDYLINNIQSSISINYTPDKDKFDDASIKTYIQTLIKDESLSIEDIASSLTEDLYDNAVPMNIIVKVEQTHDGIHKVITAEKGQPKRR